MKKADFKAEKKSKNWSFWPFPFGIPFIWYLELAHRLLLSLPIFFCWKN